MRGKKEKKKREFRTGKKVCCAREKKKKNNVPRTKWDRLFFPFLVVMEGFYGWKKKLLLHEYATTKAPS